jgi:superfamily I DNA and/or RNA helicase
MEIEDGTSYYNECEADAIIYMLSTLDNCGESLQQIAQEARDKGCDAAIGIVTTYKAQSKAVKNRLISAQVSEDLKDECKIDTVDSYQGKQNPIIILSLTRSNAAGIAGFVRSVERLNVSLSRAMDRLVIVGSLEFWRSARHGEAVARLIEFIEKQIAAGDKRYFIRKFTTK